MGPTITVSRKQEMNSLLLRVIIPAAARGRWLWSEGQVVFLCVCFSDSLNKSSELLSVQRVNKRVFSVCLSNISVGGCYHIQWHCSFSSGPERLTLYAPESRLVESHQGFIGSNTVFALEVPSSCNYCWIPTFSNVCLAYCCTNAPFQRVITRTVLI